MSTEETELDIVTRQLIDAARHWHRHRQGGSDMALDMAVARYEEVAERQSEGAS